MTNALIAVLAAGLCSIAAMLALMFGAAMRLQTHLMVMPFDILRAADRARAAKKEARRTPNEGTIE